MEPLERAKRWFDKANDEINDEIDRFIYLWIVFNILYYEFTKSGKEDKRISSFIQKNLPNNSIELLHEVSQSILFTQKVKNLLGERFYNEKNYQLLTSDQSSTVERIIALFLTIYQIRCNLFHGGKDLDAERDNQLVKVSGDILFKYLSNHLRMKE